MKRLALLAACVAAGSASAAPRAMPTWHVPDEVVHGTARKVGVPPAARDMELAISLKLRDEAGLRALLRQIYDPASPSFRHYLSVGAFTDRFGPLSADYQALQAFAASHHLAAREPAANRLVLDVHGSVADVESAFNIRIGLYRHEADGRVFYAPDREPTADLAAPLLHVSGLDNAVLPTSHMVRGGTADHISPNATGSGPGGQFIGSDIRAAYYGGTALTGTGQSVGLLEYAGYNLEDLKLYFKTVKQPLNVPVKGVSLNGASLECDDNCNDGEQMLDMEEAISLAPAMDRLVVYVGHSDVSMLNRMATDNICKQLSSSWGWNTDPSSIDPILQEFAAQGQSFVDATGDDGYHLAQGVVWPADDQTVTAVGGTDLTTDGAGGPWASETGWSGSGGGPSPNNIAIPNYQVPFITKKNKGSTTLRNVPDIAGDADTDNYSCYDGGCYGGNGGTSYAAPILAGFLALVNQQAVSAGGATVGFLNPTLYRLGAKKKTYKTQFHDEVSGYNGYFSALKGFDLVTGFGSQNGQAFIDALIAGK